VNFLVVYQPFLSKITMSAAKHARLSREAYRLFESSSPEDRIKILLSMKAPEDERFISRWWEQQCQLREFKTLAPGQALATFAFKIDRFYCNGSGNLQGGAQAAMLDICTSLVVQALAKQPKIGLKPGLDHWINGGVSRTLTVHYLRPAPEGTDVLMECEIVQAGRSMALLKAVLKRESDGVILSTCEHEKAAVMTKPGFGDQPNAKL
jgi:acyl-coenzyme A thioesterase 13